jgi:hypothetical protein
MKKSMAICLVVLVGLIALPASANLVTITNTEGDSQDLMIISGTVEKLGDAPAFPADERISSSYDVLISETQDLIFELGETWAFVIQDYTNSLGPAPSLFGSLGVGGDSEKTKRGENV